MMRSDINETLLHYIWKNKLFESINCKNKKIQLIETGIHNKDAGPDFFNAKIKIDGTLWAGNVEIHKKASDWNKHKHQEDKAYDNVILQIVTDNDKAVFNSKGNKILTAELEFSDNLIFAYKKLKTSNQDIPCHEKINQIDSFSINSWLSSLLVERLEEKTQYINSVLAYTKNNWEETFYILLARSFGFKVNAEPFELMAKSLPSLILSKNRTHLFKIEALLFGQAGFFNKDLDDEFFIKLKKEYLYQKNKYNLAPIGDHLWKFLRIRPTNFPTIRIAQFAQLIYRSSNLFSKVIEASDIKTLYNITDLTASEYWDTHYTFGKQTKKQKKNMGKAAKELLILNTIIPFMFIYGQRKNLETVKSRAIFLLENINAENNAVIKKWETIGIKAKNAYFSQALLQLYNQYCQKKKCLNCRIGNQYINTYV